MKRFLALAGAVVFGAIVCGSSARPAHAAPLAESDVASGAKWLVHVDIDAFHETKIGGQVHDRAQKNERLQKFLGRVNDDLGMDLEKDLHGATVYGTDFTRDTAVLIVYAHADKEKIMAKIRSKPDFAESKTNDGQDIYSWSEKLGGGGQTHTIWVAFPKSGMGVHAANVETLKAALAVIGGKGGLSSSSPLLADVPKGAFLSGSAIGITEANLPVKSPMTKQIDEIHLAVGENDGDDFVSVKVDTTSADATKQLKSMVDSLTGIVSLQATEHPEIQQLMNGLKVEADGKALNAEFKIPADDLIKILDKMREERMHRQAKPGSEAPSDNPGKN